MQLSDLENAVINSFIHYDTAYLKSIDPNGVYSFNYKEELITNLKREIEKLKINYPEGLYVKKSLCRFCFSGSNAFSFYSKNYDNYVMRYVIAVAEDQYIVQPCNNKPIPDGDNEMPF